MNWNRKISSLQGEAQILLAVSTQQLPGNGPSACTVPMYLYGAIDSNGDTVEFWFSERRNLTAAQRFLRKALKRHGRPERIVIDGSQTNREAILSCGATSRLQDGSGAS